MTYLTSLRLLAVPALLFINFSLLSAQTIDVSKQFVSIELSKSAELTIDLKDDATKFLNSFTSPSNDYVTVTQKSFSEKSLVFTLLGKKATSAKVDLVLPLKLSNEAERSATVKVSVIDPTQFTLDIPKIDDAVQGGPTKQIRMTPAVEDDRVTIVPSGTLGKITYKSGVINITPTVAGKFGLNIKVDGILVKENVPVDIRVGVSALEANTPIDKKQGEEIKIENLGIKLLTTDNPPRDISAECIANAAIEPQDDGIVKDGEFYRITNKRVGTSVFKLTCRGEQKMITVNIGQARGRVVPSSYSVTLKVNTPEKLVAQVLDKSGAIIPNEKIVWEPEPGKSAEYAKFVEITSQSDSEIFLKLRSVPDEGQIRTIKLFAVSSADPEIKSDPIELVNQKVSNVTSFGKLRVHLENLEDKTTRDDFGSEMMKHYFVTKVTFDNNLKDADNKGATLLIFNQSIEAKTFIEYEDPDVEGRWIPVNRAMVIPTLARTEKNEDRDFDWEHWKESGVLNKLETRVREGVAVDFLSLPGRRIADLKKCEIKEDLDHVYPYQPMRYETALLTHDSRENGSLKNRILTGLLGLSSLTSFVTNIVGAGGDWPGGQDQFRNLLIPAYQRFFPDRREIHKDHLIQEMMQPLLQVPFGSQESKYLLFPRGPINVSYPMRHWVGQRDTSNKQIYDESGRALGQWEIKTVRRIRIRGISPSDTCATVALIRKDE